MNWFDFFNHVFNLLLPALGVALLLGLWATAIKRKSPASSWWWRMVGVNALVGAVVLMGGLFLLGGDGHMATYGALVLVMGTVHAWYMRR